MSSSSTAFSSATQETLKPKQHYGLYVVLWLCGLAVFWRTVFTGLWPDSFLNYVVPLYSFVGANLSPDDDDSDPNTIDADEQFGWMEFIGVLILVYGILVAISLKNVRIANILYKQRVWMTGIILCRVSFGHYQSHSLFTVTYREFISPKRCNIHAAEPRFQVEEANSTPLNHP